MTNRITVFCVHDADAAAHDDLSVPARGYHLARRERSRSNLGLEPWEARAAGLEAETIERKRDRRPVGRAVPEYEAGWLQTHRIRIERDEPPGEFVAWLDEKIAEYPGKVISPADPRRPPPGRDRKRRSPGRSGCGSAETAGSGSNMEKAEALAGIWPAPRGRRRGPRGRGCRSLRGAARGLMAGCGRRLRPGCPGTV